MAFFNLHHLLQTASHQHWILPLVFLLSLLESLAVIGTFIPGATALFIAGTLVGAGALNFWQTIIYSVCGAIIGDGLSYWLGHHYQETIICYWPFRRYPGLLQKSEAFFAKHGGKSVVIGRFFGPVRAMVPVVAGMVRMPPIKFYTLNILSALIWAPAHILPGALLGASLVLAEAITMRLVIVIVIIVAIILVSLWSTEFLLRVVIVRFKKLRKRALMWSRTRDNIWSQALQNLLEPTHPSFNILLSSLILLIIGIIGFFEALQAIVMQTALVNADTAVYHFLQNLRSPWMDHFMFAVSTLAGSITILPLLIVMLGWLSWKRNLSVILYWVAALGFALVLVPTLKLVSSYPRPLAPLGFDIYSFPSTQATLAATVYGFMAYLIARELKPIWRMPVVLIAACFILIINFSTLYLGEHWLSDVLGGLCLGLAWVAFLAIIHTWHDPHPVRAKPLAYLLLVTLTTSQILFHLSKLDIPLSNSSQADETRFISISGWQSGKWNLLPTRRSDFGGAQEEPFVIQWAGTKTSIANRLTKLGWKRAPVTTYKTLTNWLMPNNSIEQLPVLPSLNDGIAAKLTFIRQVTPGQSRLVLRFWKTSIYVGIGVNATPIWLGSLRCEKIHHLLSYVTFARASTTCTPDSSYLYENLANFPQQAEVLQRVSTGLTLVMDMPRNSINSALTPVPTSSGR
ncbi:MAG TPA: VTT domain-containing protein [Burkholderiales bacterium]|nr:VTT domain-containing protein [Burkholderiales bacterium]